MRRAIRVQISVDSSVTRSCKIGPDRTRRARKRSGGSGSLQAIFTCTARTSGRSHRCLHCSDSATCAIRSGSAETCGRRETCCIAILALRTRCTVCRCSQLLLIRILSCRTGYRDDGVRWTETSSRADKLFDASHVRIRAVEACRAICTTALCNI